jgi:putative membrane-bound dehydrogenase-like protein
MTQRAPRIFGLLIAGITVAMPALGQVSPEESAKQMKPAPGLEAKLWASEPMVLNPTTIDIDSRGRVWVTEGLNYRLTRGRNQRFSRIEEADKIKILEDTDLDGKADKMTVFADQIFPVPMGIAIEEHYDKAGKYQGCKVYVGNSPNLLVLEDTDGDDKADVRYPLLTGFGGIDSDHGVHGPVLGLDGKIYFTHGDGCCSVQPDKHERTQNFDVTDKSGRHVSSDQLANTLRVNRDGTQFEVIADRQRNNYETCLNSFGNIFTSDNDDDGNRGSRVIWVMDGGTYGYRTPGSPRHWGEEVPGNVPKLVGTGNGSPCGIQVYEGELLPNEYFGCLFESEAGTRQVNFFPITRKGAAFRTEYKVLVGSEDPWFRPVDTATAPDGAVFVADWYDAGVGGHAFSDQTTGRIYRVAPLGAKSKRVTYDFGTVEGLIAALKSSVIATQDAARRGLIAEGTDADSAVVGIYQDLDAPANLRARALWTLVSLRGGSTTPADIALKDADARIRELGVRILGRDVSREGAIEYQGDAKPSKIAAEAHLEKLLPLADDPDAGVRRELILAIRYLPTDEVGGALKTLAANWDGQDRWYLEALGLALRDREPDYLSSTIFDGKLYGDLDLDHLGKLNQVALPPYFPVDRNEAFISASDPEPPPANALSKTLGLMWELRRVEALPLLTTIAPHLEAPSLQQAADDVLTPIEDPAGAVAVADVFFKLDDPVRQRQFLRILARRLSGTWRASATDEKVIRAIEGGLSVKETRADAIAAAAATGDRRFADHVLASIDAADAPMEVRIAGVEALGRLRPPQARQMLEAIVERARSAKSSDPLAEAALRTLTDVGVERGRMIELLAQADLPLGLRREALAEALQEEGTAHRVIQLAKEGKLPADLKSDAAAGLSSHPSHWLRREAAEVLPISGTSGRPLPPFDELVSREGNAEHGRELFYREGKNACSACHRVHGRGQWVGPDLSTIGTKYGKDGLLTSILSPSAAIGYNFRSYVVALTDGRVLTGLPVEESADRLVLKTADGKRISIDSAEIDERRLADVSLMPEGLAQAVTDQELVDLLSYLSTLKQPVSIIGEFQAVGPVSESSEKPALAATARPDSVPEPVGSDGKKSAWRRLRADAEGRVDLGTLAGAGSVYLHVPVNAPEDLTGRLVLEAPAEIQAWLDAKPLELPKSSGDGAVPREIQIDLESGPHDLLLRVPAGADSWVIATIVADREIEFRPAEVASK